MDLTQMLAIQTGRYPDRYSNLINGKSAGEKMIANRKKIVDQYNEDAEIRQLIHEEATKQADLVVEKILKQIMR